MLVDHRILFRTFLTSLVLRTNLSFNLEPSPPAQSRKPCKKILSIFIINFCNQKNIYFLLFLSPVTRFYNVNFGKSFFVPQHFIWPYFCPHPRGEGSNRKIYTLKQKLNFPMFLSLISWITITWLILALQTTIPGHWKKLFLLFKQLRGIK